MRCKFCNIEVDCKSHICPLCHEKLESSENDKKTDYAFPPKCEKNIKKQVRHFTLSNIYIAVATIIFIVCIAVNIGLNHPVNWFWLVGAVLVYGFLTYRNTIMSSNSAFIKTFWQIVMISLIMWLTQVLFKPVLDDINWLFDFVLPTVIMVSVLTIGIISCVVVKKDTSLLYDTLFVSLIGFLPIILYAVGVIESVIASAICAGLCAVIIVCVIVFARKEIIAELSRRFHF